MRDYVRTVAAAGWVLALVACGARDGVDVAAETAALMERAAALAAAEAAQDRQAALDFWAEDAIVHFAGSPPIVGRDGIAAMYDQFFPQIREFEAASTQVEMAASGDLAWELGTNRAVVIGGMGDLLDVGKYLAVWRKIGGEWYVVAVAASSDTPLMSPAP